MRLLSQENHTPLIKLGDGYYQFGDIEIELQPERYWNKAKKSETLRERWYIILNPKIPSTRIRVPKSYRTLKDVLYILREKGSLLQVAQDKRGDE